MDVKPTGPSSRFARGRRGAIDPAMCASLVAITAWAHGSHGQELFEQLPRLPEDTACVANAISPAGDVVAGGLGTPLTRRGVAWIRSGDVWAIRSLADLGGPTTNVLALGASGDVLAGLSSNRAVVWRGVLSPSPVIEPVFGDTRTGAATALSADGAFVVGYAQNPSAFIAFRAGPQGDPAFLGALAGGNISQGLGMSADASIVVGTSGTSSTQRGFAWSGAAGLTQIPSDGYAISACRAVSADGAVVGGLVSNSLSTLTLPALFVGPGFATLRVLELPEGSSRGVVLALSGDGRVAVGQANLGPAAADPSVAVYWIDGRVRLVRDELLARGANVASVALEFANGVTPDGKLIVGSGFDGETGVQFAFVARIDSACNSIDFDGDGVFPDLQDIVAYLDVFAGGQCPTASCAPIDYNNDGVFPDLADVVALLRVFSGGTCEG